MVNDIINKSEFHDYGARKVNKIIVKYVENEIIDGIINNEKFLCVEFLENKRNLNV